MILFYLLACAWFASGEVATDKTNTGNEFPGALHMMGLCLINNLQTPSVKCWKGPMNNQISPLFDEIPSDLGPVKSLKMTFTKACAILEDDTVRCWGDRPAFPKLEASGTKVKQLLSGTDNICAVLADDSVRCSYRVNQNRPQKPNRGTLLAAPGNLYWLREGGEVSCRDIGAGKRCKEGYVNQKAMSRVPKKSEWKEAAFAGVATVCLILNDNRVHCPISTTSGGPWLDSPVNLGQGEVFNLQVSSQGQLCVQRRSDSVLVCIGAYGGSSATSDARQPEAARGKPVHSYKLGEYHICAVLKDDWSLHCWGWKYTNWVDITKKVTDFIAKQHRPENPDCKGVYEKTRKLAKRACKKLSGCRWRNKQCKKDNVRERRCKRIFKEKDPSLCTGYCKPVYKLDKRNRKKYIQCVPN